ncbi:MAG: DUF4190 domain-containing protein [Clostridia bacterium]
MEDYQNNNQKTQYEPPHYTEPQYEPPHYTEPQYEPPRYSSSQNQAPTNGARGMSITSMILGIISCALSFTVIFSFCGIILSVLGIIFFCMAKNRYDDLKINMSGQAITGLICSIVGLLLSVAMTLLMIFIFRFALQYVPWFPLSTPFAM